MHSRYVSEGDLLRSQNKRGTTLFALYGIFFSRTLHITILSHKINLNAKQLPSTWRLIIFSCLKSGACATWTQQGLSIVLPQLLGAPWIWGPLEMAVLLSLCAAAAPSAHPLCFPENKTVDCSAEYKTDNPVILNSKVTGCYFNEVCQCQG